MHRLRRLFVLIWQRLLTHRQWVMHGLLVATELCLLVALLRNHLFYWLPYPALPRWWAQLPASVQPAVITVSGTFMTAIIAGSVALRTLFVKDRQEREHFDRQELNEQFTDILNRFADKDSPLMRASAAERLGAIAERRLPGRP